MPKKKNWSRIVSELDQTIMNLEQKLETDPGMPSNEYDQIRKKLEQARFELAEAQQKQMLEDPS